MHNSNHGGTDPDAIIAGYRKNSRRNPQQNDITTIVRQFIPYNFSYPSTCIVWHDRTTQYRFRNAGGASCGLAASNFVRLVFKEYSISRKGDEAFLRWLLTKQCALDIRSETDERPQDITEISQYYKNHAFLEVRNIVGSPAYNRKLPDRSSLHEDKVPGVPYFTDSLRADPPMDGLTCTYESFLQILRGLDGIKGISAAIITCASQIVAAMKIPIDRAYNKNIYVVYDSHGSERLHYPYGAGMIICRRPKNAARFLAMRYLPPSDRNQMMEQVTASIVTPQDRQPLSREGQTQRLMELSVRILSAEADKVTSKKDLRESKRERMQQQQQLQQQLQQLQQLQQQLQQQQQQHSNKGNATGYQTEDIPQDVMLENLTTNYETVTQHVMELEQWNEKLEQANKQLAQSNEELEKRNGELAQQNRESEGQKGNSEQQNRDRAQPCRGWESRERDWRQRERDWDRERRSWNRERRDWNQRYNDLDQQHRTLEQWHEDLQEESTRAKEVARLWQERLRRAEIMRNYSDNDFEEIRRCGDEAARMIIERDELIANLQQMRIYQSMYTDLKDALEEQYNLRLKAALKKRALGGQTNVAVGA
ncbi:hypothetical protein C0995_015753 [Termitomyces sp. Mi166|nr:hypothetical protein C0995_015753 [Termitomyces sp. Mi166\